jgi:hypothetical protein
MVNMDFQTAGSPVDYSSPTTYSNTMTAGYSILGESVDPVNAPGAALVGGLGENSANSSVDTCNLFGGGKRRRKNKKSKRSRKLKRSNKSRLSTRSKKSRSKSRSKVKKSLRKSLRKSNRNKRKSLR